MADAKLADLTDGGTPPEAAILYGDASGAGTTGNDRKYGIPGLRAAVASLFNINPQTGTTYTLVAGDSGKIVRLTNAAGITLTLPNSLPVGFNCLVIQGGAGQVTFSPASGGSINNRQTHTKLAGQYAAASLVVVTNTGTNAAYNLSGDTAA